MASDKGPVDVVGAKPGPRRLPGRSPNAPAVKLEAQIKELIGMGVAVP